MNTVIIAERLTLDEGKGKPGQPGVAYLDTEGIPTVGIGRNLKAVGLSADELSMCIRQDMVAYDLLDTIATNDQIHMRNERFTFDSMIAFEALVEDPLSDGDMEYILYNDIDVAIGCAESALESWHELPDYVQEVMTQVMFNLGIGTFKKFRNMIKAVNAGNWKQAAAELLDSRAARQTGSRYQRYANVLKSGDRAAYELS